MEEEYDFWNFDKKYLASNPRKPLFKEGEIWWCSVGLNLGSEVRGKGEKFRRPILVIKKLSEDSCIILPLTTQKSFGVWFFPIDFPTGRQWIMLHQIRMIHTKRFQRKLFTIKNSELIHIKEKLKLLLESS